jgi:arsenite methyltransferase
MKQTKAHSDAIRRIVSDNYVKIAATFGSCCHLVGPTPCCGDSAISATQIGYSKAQVESAPEAAKMGLGCGNPQAIANLRLGEVVLDLGSGAGFDAILAAQAVGNSGYVIGVDMTDAMIQKAQRNVRKRGLKNVDFRRGEIENLPVKANTVDVIISNCVVNLSPDKEAVFKEAYRVLKKGGRIAISDVVAVRPLPESIQEDKQLYCACIAGAVTVEHLYEIIVKAGFEKIRITTLDKSKDLIEKWVPIKNAQDYVTSAFIEAVKA